MKIVAIGLSKNEADVIQECVRDALSWVDAFVLYDSSTDDTATLARQAGAVVLEGDPGETFNEILRQYTLTYAAKLEPDWIVRIDPDEFYPRGVSFKKGKPQDPRAVLETLDAEGVLATRANVIQFWITLDDVRRGLLLEDEKASVQVRRRWYSVGHTAVVAWKHHPELAYKPGEVKNIPFYPDGRDVGQALCASAENLIQTHYTCRSLSQLVARMADRQKDQQSFGKYVENLIIDEQVAGLFYWSGGPFWDVRNHEGVYQWFKEARALYEGRMGQ